MHTKNLQIVSIFSFIFLAIITALGVFIFSSLNNSGSSLNNSNQAVNTSPSSNQENPTSSVCVDLQGSELQNCCRQWAIDNDIFTIQCEGAWELNNNSCSFECTSNPEDVN